MPKLAGEGGHPHSASSSTDRQVSDELLQVIAEQGADLDEHVERVSTLSRTLAEALGQSRHEVLRVQLAARLHDVGKTAIPISILDKPGPLDAQQQELVRRHPEIGARIVMAAPALASTAPLIRSSHEHYDGGGYPDGLRGQAIPIGSRIISVCDAFDAMTSRRPYRLAMTSRDAFAELQRCSGKQFDPDVVDAFGALHAAPQDFH